MKEMYGKKLNKQPRRNSGFMQGAVQMQTGEICIRLGRLHRC